MASSQWIEKLKFGGKYILANIVIIPLEKPSDNYSQEEEEYELAARNKYLTRDIWQSFIYRKMYDLFRKHFNDPSKDADALCQINKEYHLSYSERPYLQMKYVFRDRAYRNNLNVLFKEKSTNLYDSSIYVEISDQGRAAYDKVHERDRTILHLLKEVSELKRETTKYASEKKKSATVPNSEIEEYHPEPLRKSARNTDEEYVPVTRNGDSPGMKRTYKPSKIVNGGKASTSAEPDPYTPETTDTPVKVSYTPTSSPQNNSALQRKPPPEKCLFGSDDDEEYVPASSKQVSAKQESKNDSDKDMFSDVEQYSPSETVSSKNDNGPKQNPSSQSSTTSLHIGSKREVLPRTSKQNARGLTVESPEQPTASNVKRKAKIAKRNVQPSKGEESIKALLKLKSGIRKKTGIKKEGSLGSHCKMEKLTEIATEMKRLNKAEQLDCTNLSQQEILDTFDRYKPELYDIFLRHKDKTERQWMLSKDLCYFTDVGHLMDEDQKLSMLQKLEDEFVPEQQRGNYTEFFTSTLLMEWGLRVFIDTHKFTSRELALECIKKQEKSYLAAVSKEFLLQSRC